MKYVLSVLMIAGLTGCCTSAETGEAGTPQETVSPRDYQQCINSLKEGDDEDALRRCRHVSDEISNKSYVQ